MGKILDEIRKIAEEKEMKLTSFQEGRIRNLERKYERKELDESGVMDELKKEFSYHLDRSDYEKIEKEILVNETQIDSAIAKKLVNIATKIRNLTELGLTETVSTRLLIDAAKLIYTGLPKRLAVSVAIVEPLSDDIEIVAALKDLTDLMI